MKIGTWYNTVEETLFNLGLPPNRDGGQQGFLVYETDGQAPHRACIRHRLHPLVAVTICTFHAVTPLNRSRRLTMNRHGTKMQQTTGPWDAALHNSTNGIPVAEACAKMTTNPWTRASCRARRSS